MHICCQWVVNMKYIWEVDTFVGVTSYAPYKTILKSNLLIF